ncbi:MAG: hypothetical protein GX428_03455 [Candidatus Atribacteria bacterium]|nr:hypothetical protein [Candidatus Atribacteria bacterium]
MKQAIQFGAGNIGRGFIGHLLWESGYRIVFVEAYPELVKLLNTRLKYPLRLLEKNGQEKNVTIDNFVVYQTEEKNKISKAIAASSIIFTAVGVKNLPAVAPLVADGIQLRLKENPHPLNILLCENLKDAPQFFKNEVETHLNDEGKKFLQEKVGFVGTVVARMVPVMDKRFGVDDPLFIVAEAYHKLPYDVTAVKGSLPEIAGLKPVQNFQSEVDKKLFIHNLGHATIAYFGYLKGYEYIHQAIADEEIKNLLDEVLKETSSSILRKYPDLDRIEVNEFVEDLKERFFNPLLMDTVYRVGRDPIRKLGEDDRIIGGIALCQSQKVFPDAILKVAGIALIYDYNQDADAVRLQSMIKNEGVKEVVRKACGVDPESDVGEKIIQSYHQFRERFRKL